MNSPIFVAGDLEPTATYAARSYRWVPGDAGDGRVGTLDLILRKRKGGPVEHDQYAVVEEPAIGYRSFLLLNLTDPGQEDVYRTNIGPRGAECTCKAGSYRVAVCKHRDGLAALLAKNHLPPPPGVVVETPAPPAPPAADDAADL